MLPRHSMSVRHWAMCFWFLVSVLPIAVSPGAAHQGDTPAVKEPGRTAAKTDRHGDRLPAGALARLGTTRWHHAAAVSFVAFLPDGKAVLTAGSDNTVRIWQAATGKELRRIDVPAPPPAIAPKKLVSMRGGARSLVALTKDGKTLAMLTGDTIRQWDVPTGRQLRPIAAPPSGMTAMLFAPDGRFLAIQCPMNRSLYSMPNPARKFAVPRPRTARKELSASARGPGRRRRRRPSVFARWQNAGVHRLGDEPEKGNLLCPVDRRNNGQRAA